MDFIFDLFTKKELMIIGVVIGSLILIILVLTLIDVLSRKKKEKEELEEMFNEFDNIEPVKKKVEIVEKVEIKEEVKEIPKVENNNIEILEEVSENKETISEVIETKANNKVDKIEYIEPLIIDIDDDIVEKPSINKAEQELLKIEEELKNPKSLEDTLYNLEIMEEENAIISYQELMENTKELNTMEIEGDTGDEPISLTEILNMYDQQEVETIDVENELSKKSINEAYKGDFTSSPYLSPILGVEFDVDYEKPSTSLAEIQLENTANLEKLDKEIRKTNEFLSILNDLKKNLD